MKQTICVAFLVITVFQFMSAMDVVGTLGNKTFYRESGSYSWSNARIACRTAGLKLAAVRNSAELNFLISKFVTLGLTKSRNAHWTAGRDVQTERQFAWDDGCVADDYVPQLNGTLVLPGESVRSALLFYIAEVTKEPVFEVKEVSSYNSALCEPRQ